MEHWPNSLCWVGDWGSFFQLMSVTLCTRLCPGCSWANGRCHQEQIVQNAMPSSFSKVSKCGVRFEECFLVFTATYWPVVSDQLTSLTGFTVLFSNLRGRVRKGDVRSLGAYVTSSLRHAFRAPSPLRGCVICVILVFAPIRWACMKSSFRNPWDVVLSMLALCLAWK